MKQTVHFACDRITVLRAEPQYGIITLVEVVTANEIQGTGFAEKYASLSEKAVYLQAEKVK